MEWRDFLEHFYYYVPAHGQAPGEVLEGSYIVRQHATDAPQSPHGETSATGGMNALGGAASQYSGMGMGGYGVSIFGGPSANNQIGMPGMDVSPDTSSNYSGYSGTPEGGAEASPSAGYGDI